MKKGTIQDVFPALVILLIVAFSIIIYAWTNNLIMSSFVNTFKDDPVHNESIQRVQASMQNTMNTFNYGFLVIYIAILLSIAVLDYHIYAHPLYIPVNLILIIITIFVSMVLANAFWQFCNSSPSIQAVCIQFNIVTFIMKNLPIFTFIYDVVIMIVLYVIKGNRYPG